MSKFCGVLLFALVAACTSDADFQELKNVIGLAGGTIESSDGKLTITFPPGAFAEDCEVIIEVTASGYRILPEGKIPDIPADFHYEFDPPEELPDGRWQFRPHFLRFKSDPVEGTFFGSPNLSRFRGKIGEFGEFRIEDSYLDCNFDFHSTAPRTLFAGIEIRNREAPGGGAPALSEIEADFLLNGERYECRAPDLDEMPGSSVTDGTTITGLPTGQIPVSLEMTSQYKIPSFGEIALAIFWNQEVDVQAATDAWDVPFEQGDLPEAPFCPSLDGFAGTTAGDEPVTVAFGDGFGIVNYSTGKTLGNGTSSFFYQHAISNYACVPGRADPNGRLQQVAPVVDVLLSVGASGAYIQYWDDTDQDFQAPVTLETVNTTDAAPYGGDPESGGFTYASNVGNFVKFLEFDATSGTYKVDSAKTITSADLPNATGAIVSAFRTSATSEVLIVTDGDPGHLWVKTPGQAGAATLVGEVGTGVRRVRTLGSVGVVSAYGGALAFGGLTFLTKESGTWGFGPFGLSGPRAIGVDLKRLPNGDVAIASCSFLHHTYRVTVVASDASIVSDETFDLPDGAEGPGHVIWLPDGGLLVTCNQTNNMVIVPPGGLP
ncbi:MAG: hypothetical protein ACYSX0_07230 [Planctomycetota bacterium]|jgi:hypothetical protein